MKAVDQHTLADDVIECGFCDGSSLNRFYIISSTKGHRICNECIDAAAEQLYYARILAEHQDQGVFH